MPRYFAQAAASYLVSAGLNAAVFAVLRRSGVVGWYVLVERVKYGEWSLVDKISVEGGKEAALARGEEITRTRPPSGSTASDPCGRLVFRTSPTSWLVELTESSWAKGDKSPTTYTEHLNIRVAELVHVQELVPAEPPKNGRFGR